MRYLAPLVLFLFACGSQKNLTHSNMKEIDVQKATIIETITATIFIIALLKTCNFTFSNAFKPRSAIRLILIGAKPRASGADLEKVVASV